MTPEEMQAALEKAQASIEKLTTKNSELIDREKAAKKAADDAEDAREESERLANEKSGDVEKIKADLIKAHQKELSKLNSTIEENSKRLSTLLIDNEIANALSRNGVMPQYAKAVTAMLKAEASLKDGQAMAGEAPLADHISAFFQGDDGKHFVAAPVNSGGGAQGSKSTIAGHGFTKENFASKIGEWAVMQKESPEEARLIAVSLGRNDLA